MRKLLHAALRLLPERTVVRVLSGELRGARWLMHSATHGCWLGTYERRVQRLFAGWVRPGDVVFDIGANVGFYTLIASRLAGPGGSVCAFEPLPRNVEFLREHVRINAAQNVRMFPIALADAAGTRRFRVADSPLMGSLSGDGSIEVTTSALDILWKEGALPLPAFVKIDVEGGEFDVLRGGARLIDAARPVVLLAAHGYVQSARCSEFLREHGFEIETVRDGTDDGDYLLFGVPNPRSSSERMTSARVRSNA